MPGTPPPATLAELRKQRKPIRNANVTHQERLTVLEQFSVWVTQKVGTIGFFFIILTWTAAWCLWNTFGPQGSRFDPYPGFVLWLFISNVIQLFLLPLIMFGQNHLDRHAETRAEEDYEISVRSEREIEAVLAHLERQNEVLADIVKKIDRGQ